MLRPFPHPVACCWMLLRVVAQSLKPVKLFSQQLPTFLLFRDRPSVAQQCWIRLHSSSNVVGATHAHYAWFTKTCGLYPSHYALQVPTLLGVVASVCTPLPTRTQQLPTLLRQQCWKLLRPFARNLNLKLFIRDLLPVNQVVGQGSVFGLALFLLFLNDFPLHWKKRRLNSQDHGYIFRTPYTVMNVFAKESKVLFQFMWLTQPKSFSCSRTIITKNKWL